MICDLTYLARCIRLSENSIKKSKSQTRYNKIKFFLGIERISLEKRRVLSTPCGSDFIQSKNETILERKKNQCLSSEHLRI